MKYYLIAGEASGDLHASHLMSVLKEKDPQAEFRFFGGDLMASEGGTLVKHYKEMAYMGFIPVLLHLRTIYANMRLCKEDIVRWAPDVVILIDYPGFNLNIAEYIHDNTSIPIYYYIAPKLWAWKEYRIKGLKKNVDELFSILPFETDFFEKKHQYPIHYVGNPTVDEISLFEEEYKTTRSEFIATNQLEDKPIIAILAGSRKQEIRDNLSRMLQAASSFKDYQLVIAAAPAITKEYYEEIIKGTSAKIIFNQTYPLLKFADAALVTSGTATLETAMFNTPQVVCYYMNFGKFVSFLRKLVLKVPYVSLVNLIVGKQVVNELIADGMTVGKIKRELSLILKDETYKKQMLEGYQEMKKRLGKPGAPDEAASLIVKLLHNKRH